MRYINLLYDNDYEDVDILAVPAGIADDIDDIAQLFFSWLTISENRQRFMIEHANGKKVLGIDTHAFLWYLNHIFLPPHQKATIIAQHTTFRPDYPTANF